MRVLFLDIDGVLNSHDWNRRRPPAPAEGLTPQTRSARAFDPKAVALLGELVQRSGASLVLSSTWRLDGGVSHVERHLAHHGLRVHFVGLTPDGSRMRPQGVVWTGCPRGTEIATWISDHAAKVDSIAILDDDDDMGALSPWLVRTHSDHGLQRDHVERAVELLAHERDDALRLAVFEQIDGLLIPLPFHCDDAGRELTEDELDALQDGVFVPSEGQ